jgi:hypothetical protein
MAPTLTSSASILEREMRLEKQLRLRAEERVAKLEEMLRQLGAEAKAVERPHGNEAAPPEASEQRAVGASFTDLTFVERAEPPEDAGVELGPWKEQQAAPASLAAAAAAPSPSPQPQGELALRRGSEPIMYEAASQPADTKASARAEPASGSSGADEREEEIARQQHSTDVDALVSELDQLLAKDRAAGPAVDDD